MKEYISKAYFIIILSIVFLPKWTMAVPNYSNQTNTENIVSNVLNDELEFGYLSIGQESDIKTYTLSYTGINEDIKIVSPSDYLISEDGNIWVNELTVNAGTEDGMVDISIKYVPLREYHIAVEQTLEHRVNDVSLYNLKLKSADSFARADAAGLNKNTTLDLVTWNLQFFGAPQKSYNANSFTDQLNAVSSKIIELDADIYALQEVVVDDLNGDFITPLVDKLNALAGETKYVGVVAPKYSFYFRSPSSDFPAQRLCFIYNINTVGNLYSESMFSDFYQDYSTPALPGYTEDNSNLFWSSGRLPQRMQAVVNINGETELLDIINIHAKCCSDGAERRLADANYLIKELNDNFSEANVIVLGDYNESYSSSSGGYSSWFENENEHYLHVAGDGIDHASISNELYDEHYKLIDNWSVDQVAISDHDPVMIRLKIENDKTEQSISLNEVSAQDVGSVVQLSGIATSGLDVVYSVVKGNATIAGNQLTINSGGELLVRAFQQGNDVYAPAFSNTISIEINKSDQTITFDPISTKTLGDDEFKLVATASSNLPVSFEVVSGGASLNGKTLYLTAAGEVTIKATQEGDEDYNAAPEVTQTFLVEEKNGIDDEYARAVSIVPNPASSIVYITTPDVTEKVVRLISLTGSTIKEQVMVGDKITFDVNNLQSGLYFIQINSGGITISKKLKVQN